MCDGKVKIKLNAITREEVEQLVDTYENIIINGENGREMLSILSNEEDDNVVESWLAKYR